MVLCFMLRDVDSTSRGKSCHKKKMKFERRQSNSGQPSCSATQLCSPLAGCSATPPAGECSASNPCKVNACCSKFGHCGFGPDFCGTGCQAMCDAKPECGQYSDDPICPLNVCCSKFGYCGTTSDFCGDGCQSNC